MVQAQLNFKLCLKNLGQLYEPFINDSSSYLCNARSLIPDVTKITLHFVHTGCWCIPHVSRIRHLISPSRAFTCWSTQWRRSVFYVGYDLSYFIFSDVFRSFISLCFTLPPSKLYQKDERAIPRKL